MCVEPLITLKDYKFHVTVVNCCKHRFLKSPRIGATRTNSAGYLCCARSALVIFTWRNPVRESNLVIRVDLNNLFPLCKKRLSHRAQCEIVSYTFPNLN